MTAPPKLTSVGSEPVEELSAVPVSLLLELAGPSVVLLDVDGSTVVPELLLP